jgi:TPR repeat protein
MNDSYQINLGLDLIDPDGLSPDQLFAKAETFFLGLGCPRNIKLAGRWYRMAADRGHQGAKKRLWRMFPESYDCEDFMAEAVVREITDKEQKDFKVHRGNPKPHELEVYDWYKRAAEAGDPEAQLKVAFFLEEGIFGPKKSEEAFRWYKMSAENGNLDAQFCMATCYRHGIGVSPSETEMFNWFLQAAEGGHARAQFSLALFCYGRGEGVEENEEKSAHWYRMASDQEYGPAMHMHAFNLSRDESSEEKQREGFELLLRGAEKGNAGCMYDLHFCYQLGEGVERDEEKALHWLIQAARHGDDNAQVALAEAFFTGGSKGVPKNFMESSHYFKRQVHYSELMAVSRLRNAVVEQWLRNDKI